MGRFRARLASAQEASGGGAGGDGEVLAAAFEAVLQRRWVESARYCTLDMSKVRKNVGRK